MGSGTQARYQLQSLLLVRRPARVLIVARNSETAGRLAHDARAWSEWQVQVEPSIEAAVREASVIITTTPSRSPIIWGEWLKHGVHITGVGADTAGKRELDAEVFARATVVVADDPEECGLRGELQYVDPTTVDVIPLGDVIGKRRTARTSPDDITVADLIGSAPKTPSPNWWFSTLGPRTDWLKPYVPGIEAMVALMHPQLEAAVHDIRTDRIVAIWNAFSRRTVGDPSLLSELPHRDGTATVLGPYGKVLPDGRRLTSVTSFLVGGSGEPRGLLCLNFDRSPFDDAVAFLTAFAVPAQARPHELFDRDWREKIALAVEEFCRIRHRRREQLDRSDRVALITDLDSKGLFSTRNAAQHVAASLGISRASVYGLLKQVRG